MFRTTQLLAVLLLLCTSTMAVEDSAAEATERIQKAEAAAIADPNNSECLIELLLAHQSWLNTYEGERDEEFLLSANQIELNSWSRIKPTKDDAIKGVEYLKDCARQELIRLRTPLADLEKSLDRNPDDVDAMEVYILRCKRLMKELTQNDPAQTSVILDAFKTRIVNVTKNCRSESMRDYLKLNGEVPIITDRLIKARNQGLLLGREAPPLEVDAWINGEPVTLAELKGKVVLLDFWEILDKRCLKKWIYLRKWHERSKDKGLVIISLTSLLTIQTTDKTTGDISFHVPDNPRDQLGKSASTYKLNFAVGLLPSLLDSEKHNQAYFRAGIPLIALVGRDGKIKLAEFGNFETHHQKIEKHLELLLKE